MKVLFLVPQQYGFFYSLKEAFEHLNGKVYPIDFRNLVGKREKQFNVQVFRLPDKWRLKWESYYLPKINKQYIEEFDLVGPDVVFIYNNEMLLPETLAYFKKKAKIAFFLGDNPFYTPTNRYFLSLLFHADAIFAPDTFWIAQLSKIGLKNMHHFYPGIPSQQYYETDLPEQVRRELETEVLYVGMNYTDSWGYRKAKFLDHFTGFNLQIHGNRHWRRWFKFFPDLEKHFIERSAYIPVDKMNAMYNAARILPVDGNPGVLNGVHFRMFEALGAGALPLMEWQNDLKEIFSVEAGLPAVKSYDHIVEMAAYYLHHEAERVERVKWMKKVITEKYSPWNNAQLISHALNFD